MLYALPIFIFSQNIDACALLSKILNGSSVVSQSHGQQVDTVLFAAPGYHAQCPMHPEVVSVANAPLKRNPTVIILNIGTDRSEQTMQTQIRLLLMEQSDQGLLCLMFCLHLLNTILHCTIQLFQLWDNYGNYFRCPNF